LRKKGPGGLCETSGDHVFTNLNSGAEGTLLSREFFVFFPAQIPRALQRQIPARCAAPLVKGL